MALVRKFQGGGNPQKKTVRTYKRIGDVVDLDNFVRQAESGFSNWLSSLNVKDEYKPLILKAYQTIIQHINDNPEDFTYKIGTGFTNTFGITNTQVNPKDKNSSQIDANGLVASYLGNLLRSMPAYTEPEVKSDKVKYVRNSPFITSTVLKSIIGNDPTSFIMLDEDSYDKDTGNRKTTNRIAYTITGLENLRNNLTNYYDFDNSNDLTDAQNRINSVIEKLRNQTVNDDWFHLSLLGFLDLDKYYTTGLNIRTTPLSQEEQTAMKTLQNLLNFINWMSINHPLYTGLKNSYRFGTNVGSATDIEINQLQLKLRAATNEQLKTLVHGYITNPNWDFTSDLTIAQLLGGNTLINGKFTSDQIIRSVFNIATNSGIFEPILNGIYLIPSTKKTNSDGSSTVYIYNSSNGTVQQVDTHQVPKYNSLYLQEYSQNNNVPITNNQWAQYYPGMFEKGGILKMQDGNSFPDWWARINYGQSATKDSTLGNYNSKYRTRTDAIGKNVNTPTIQEAYNIQRNYLNNNYLENDTKALYNDWLKTNSDKTIDDFITYYNELVNKFRTLGTTRISKNHGDTGFKDIFDIYNLLYRTSGSNNYDISKGYIGSESTLNDILGYSNFNRNILAFQNNEDMADKRTLTLGENLPQIHVKDDGTIERVLVENDTTKTNDTDKNDTDKSGDTDGNVNTTDSDLNETNLPLVDRDVKAKTNVPRLMEDLGLDLLGTGRLMSSIHSNNRIADTVRKSLRAPILSTYEKYSPVVGDFSTLQQYNQYGSDVLSKASRPITSDASLASAAMLEAQLKADQLKALGFNADNTMIRETKNAALNNQYDNMTRRSNVANENIKAINLNNKAIAQLDAAKQQKNWASIDTYMQEVERNLRNTVQGQRKEADTFKLNTATSSIDTWKNEQIKRIREKYNAQMASLPDDKRITYDAWLEKNHDAYTNAINDINLEAEAKKNVEYAKLHGLEYKFPTDSNGIQIQPFDINKYTWNKYGGTLRPNFSYLINKIIKDYENNS